MSFFLRTQAAMKAALETIGFDPALLEKDPQALAAHVDGIKADAVSKITAQLAAQSDELTAAQADLASAAAQLEEAAQLAADYEARAETLSRGIAAAGVKLPAPAAGKAISDPAAVAQSIRDKVSILAQEKLAASGHGEPLSSAPVDSPANPGQPAATGLDATRAAIAAQIATLGR